MLQRMVASGLLAVTMVVAESAPVAAQSTTTNLGISYSFLRLLNDGDLNMPAGWLVSFAGPIERTPVLLVGEAAGNYRSQLRATLHLHTFQAGFRVVGRTTPDVHPYGQLLFGVMNVGCCDGSTNHFAIEPGVGVDVNATRDLAFRFGASFPLAFGDGDTLKSLRLQAGVVLPLVVR